jgi:hypothetical protein
MDVQDEAQEVVDDFFQEANIIAETGRDITECKQKLAKYKD